MKVVVVVKVGGGGCAYRGVPVSRVLVTVLSEL